MTKRLVTSDDSIRKNLLKTIGLFLKYILLTVAAGFLLAVVVYVLNETKTVSEFACLWLASSLLMAAATTLAVFRYFGFRFGAMFVVVQGAAYSLWFYFLPDIIDTYVANEPAFLRWWHT